MVSRIIVRSFMLFTAALAFAAPANAQTALVDYVGFAYEDGGIVPSNPGDVLTVLTVASAVDPVFGVPAGQEVTIVLSDLVSTGEFLSGTTTVVSYTGGTLSMYSDASNDSDWGENPPNGTAPASFSNGDLVFEGAFTNFTLFIGSTGAGAFEGDLDATGGSALANVCANCAYSFAGVFTDATGAQIPEGYDVQVDGTLEVDSTIPNDETSFGGLKVRFGQ